MSTAVSDGWNTATTAVSDFFTDPVSYNTDIKVDDGSGNTHSVDAEVTGTSYFWGLYTSYDADVTVDDKVMETSGSTWFNRGFTDLTAGNDATVTVGDVTLSEKQDANFDTTEVSISYKDASGENITDVDTFIERSRVQTYLTSPDAPAPAPEEPVLYDTYYNHERILDASSQNEIQASVVDYYGTMVGEGTFRPNSWETSVRNTFDTEGQQVVSVAYEEGYYYRGGTDDRILASQAMREVTADGTTKETPVSFISTSYYNFAPEATGAAPSVSWEKDSVLSGSMNPGPDQQYLTSTMPEASIPSNSSYYLYEYMGSDYSMLAYPQTASRDSPSYIDVLNTRIDNALAAQQMQLGMSDPAFWGGAPGSQPVQLDEDTWAMRDGRDNITLFSPTQTTHYTGDSVQTVNHEEIDVTDVETAYQTGGSFDDALSYIKQTGAYTSEDISGPQGVLHGEKVGFTVDPQTGQADIAIVYTSEGNYNDGYYLKDVSADEPVLSVESYDKNADHLNGVLYDINETTQDKSYEFNSGLKITVQGDLEKTQASQWHYGPEGEVSIDTAEFGGSFNGGPVVTAVETVTLKDVNGTVTADTVTRQVLEDAYINRTPVEGGSDKEEPEQSQMIKDFTLVIQSASGQMLKGDENKELQYFSSKYLDFTRALTISRSLSEPDDPSKNFVQATTRDGVVITATGVEFGKDWRNDYTILTGDDSKGFAQKSVATDNGWTDFRSYDVTFNNPKTVVSGASYDFSDRTQNVVVNHVTDSSGKETGRTTYVNVSVNDDKWRFDAAGASYVDMSFDKNGKLTSSRLVVPQGGWAPLVGDGKDVESSLLGMVSNGRIENSPAALEYKWNYDAAGNATLAGFLINGKQATESQVFSTPVNVTTFGPDGAAHQGTISNFQLRAYEGSVGVYGVFSQGEYFQDKGAPAEQQNAAGPAGTEGFKPSAEIVWADDEGRMVFSVDPSKHNGIEIVHGSLSAWQAGAEYSFGADVSLTRGAVTYRGGDNAVLRIGVDEKTGNTYEIFANTTGEIDRTKLGTDIIMELEGGKMALSGSGPIEFKTDANGVMTTVRDISAAYYGRGSLANGTIAAGATLMLDETADGKTRLTVDNGEFSFSGWMTVYKDDASLRGSAPDTAGNQQDQQSLQIPEVQTRAKIMEGSDRFVLYDGRVSIRGGNFAVVGKGTVFLTGSKLADGSTVAQGNLVIAGFNEQGQPLFAAEATGFDNTVRLEKTASGEVQVQGAPGTTETVTERLTFTDVITLDTKGEQTRNVTFKRNGETVTVEDPQALDEGRVMVSFTDKSTPRAYVVDFNRNSISADGTYYLTLGDVRSKYVLNKGILDSQNSGTEGFIGNNWLRGQLVTAANNKDVQVFVALADPKDPGKATDVRNLTVSNGVFEMGRTRTDNFGIASMTSAGPNGGQVTVMARWNGRGLVYDSFNDLGAGVNSATAELNIYGNIVPVTIKDGKLQLSNGSALALNYEGKTLTITGFEDIKFENGSIKIGTNGTLALGKGQTELISASNFMSEIVTPSDPNAKQPEEYKGGFDSVLEMRDAGGGYIEFRGASDKPVTIGVNFNLIDAANEKLNKNISITSFSQGTEVRVIDRITIPVRATGASTVMKDSDGKVSMTLQGGVLDIQAGTVIHIKTTGGLVQNLGNIVQGQVFYYEQFTVTTDKTTDTVQRKLVFTAGAKEPAVTDISVNGTAIMKDGQKTGDTDLQISNKDFHINLAQGAMATGLELKVNDFFKSAWNFIGGGWGVAKIAVGVIGAVAGAVIVGLLGWTGIGAVAGVALIAASISFIGVGALTYAETGNVEQALKEGAISAAFAAIPAIGMAGGLTGSVVKTIGLRVTTAAAGRGLTAVVARVAVSSARFLNVLFNPLAKGWLTNNVAKGLVTRMAAYSGKNGIVKWLVQPLLKEGGEAAMTNALSTLGRMGLNAAVYKGLPALAEEAGIIDETSPLYDSISNLIVLSPLMFSGMGPVSGKVDSALFSRATWKEVVAGAKNAFSSPKAFGNAVKNFVVPWWPKGGMSSALGSVSKQSVGKAVKGMLGEVAEGINPLVLVPRTMGIVADVTLFQTGSSAIFGTINSLLGGDAKQWWIFSIPKFESASDAIFQLSNSAVESTMNMLPNPGMAAKEFSQGNILGGLTNLFGFAAGIAIAQPILGPIVRNLPGLGPTVRWIGDKGAFFGGKLASGRWGRIQGFIYEEGFQEQLPQMLGGRVLGEGQASEIFQEMFDRRGGLISARTNTTPASRLGGSFTGSVNSARVTNTGNIQDIQSGINETLKLNGATHLSVGLQTIQTGGRPGVQITISDLSQPGAPVVATTMEAGSDAQLRNLALSIGAAAVAGNAVPSLDAASFVNQVNLNNAVLQNNADAMQRLSGEQKVNVLAGIAPFAGADGSLDVSASRIEEVSRQENGLSRISQYVEGVLLLASSERNDASRAALLETFNIEVALNVLTAAGSDPALGLKGISDLAGVAAAIADSTLESSVRQSMLTRLMAGFNGALAGLDFSSDDTQLENDLISNKHNVMTELQNLGNALTDLSDSNQMLLFASAFLSSPRLFEIARLYSRINQSEEGGRSIATTLLSAAYGLNVDAAVNNILMIDNMGLEEGRRDAIKASLVSGLTSVLELRLRLVTSLAGDDIRAVQKVLGVIDGIALNETTSTDIARSIVALETILNKQDTSRLSSQDRETADQLRAAIEAKKSDQNIRGQIETVSAEQEATSGRQRSVDAGLRDRIQTVNAEFNASGRTEEAAQIASGKVSAILFEYLHQAAASRFTAEEMQVLEQYLSLKLTSDSTDEERALEKKLAQQLDDYAKKHGIPFGMGLLKGGFNQEQTQAFTAIYQALFAGEGTVEEAMARYAHQLKTAGGKTIIGLYTMMLLSLNKTDMSRFIGWFTNEESNAKDLYNHMQTVFGDSLGSVLLLSKESAERLEKSGKLREELEKADILLMTYSQWSSMYSLSLSKLLSYDSETVDQNTKAAVDHNRQLLEKAGIPIEEEKDAKGKTLKVRLKNPADSHRAVQVLLTAGMGLETTDIPLGRIGDAIADELDYFATIPMSALATFSGKYTRVSALAQYYERLANGEQVKAEEYQELGITPAILNADRARASSPAGRAELQKMAAFYTDLSAQVAALSENGKKKVSGSEIDKLIRAIKNSEQGASLDQKFLEKVVTRQLENLRALYYFQGLLPSVQSFVDARQEDKGPAAIKNGGDSGEQLNLDSSDQTGLGGWLNDALDGTKTTDTPAAEVPAPGKKLSNEEFKKQLDAMVKELHKEYGDLFTEAQIREHLLTGMSAVELYNAQQRNTGSGAYTIVNGEIKITNNGEPVENLTMPGMWALELLNGLEDVSRPTRETFVSNSVESMGAWNSMIGFSGTFSPSVKNLLVDLRFGEPGGGIGSGLVVGVHTALVQSQSTIGSVIVNTTREVEANGFAAVNMILTPNFDITDLVVDTLKKQGVDENQIVYLSLTNIDSQLTNFVSSFDEAQRKKFNVTQEGIASMATGAKLKLLQDILKDKVRSGQVKYVVGDAYLLGRGWNVGKMGEAVDGLKGLYRADHDGQDPAQEKVQATLWLVNMDQMDATQLEQAMGRIDHRTGENRFSTQYYNRGVVQITSVESAREHQVVRDAAKENGGYSTQLILKYLNIVMSENEKSKLEKAGQKVVMTAQEQWERASRETSQPTVAQAEEQLVQKGLTAEQAAQQLARIGIDTKNGANTLGSGDPWFRFDRLSKFYDLMAGALSLEDMAKITLDDGDMKAVAAGDTASLLKLALGKMEAMKAGGIAVDEAVYAKMKGISTALGNLAAATSQLSPQEAQVAEMMRQGSIPPLSYPVVALKHRDARRVLVLEKELQGQINGLYQAILSGKEIDRQIPLLALLSASGTGAFNETAFTRTVSVLSAIEGIEPGLMENLSYDDMQSFLAGKIDSVGLLEKLIAPRGMTFFNLTSRSNPSLRALAATVEQLKGKMSGRPFTFRLLTMGDVLEASRVLSGKENAGEVDDESIRTLLAMGNLALGEEAIAGAVAKYHEIEQFYQGRYNASEYMKTITVALLLSKEFGVKDGTASETLARDRKAYLAKQAPIAAALKAGEAYATENPDALVTPELVNTWLGSDDQAARAGLYELLGIEEPGKGARTEVVSRVIPTEQAEQPAAQVPGVVTSVQSVQPAAPSSVQAAEADEMIPEDIVHEVEVFLSQVNAAQPLTAMAPAEVEQEFNRIMQANGLALEAQYVGAGEHAMALSIGGWVVKIAESGQGPVIESAKQLLKNKGLQGEAAPSAVKTVNGQTVVIQQQGTTLKDQLVSLAGDREGALALIDAAALHLALLGDAEVGYEQSGDILDNIGVINNDSSRVVAFDFANITAGRSEGQGLVMMLESIDRLEGIEPSLKEEMKARVVGHIIPVLLRDALEAEGTSVFANEFADLMLRPLGLSVAILEEGSIKAAEAILETVFGAESGKTGNWETEKGILLEKVFGVTAPQELNLYLAATLQVCQNTGELYQKLGIEYTPAVQAKGAAVEEITKAYFRESNKVLILAKEGKLTGAQAEVQLGIYKTTRDLLIALNTGENRAQMTTLLESPTVEVSQLVAVMSGAGNTVAGNVLLQWAAEEQKAGNAVEIVVDARTMADIRSAVETKMDAGAFTQLWMAISGKLSGEQTLEEKMKDVLGGDFQMEGGIIDRSTRLLDPVSSKGFTSAA
ncbi:MAG: hypothetical protein ACYC5N_00770 [Endomicrobiales bacterium]